MTQARMVTIDGNEAAAYIAHMTNEVIAIYPITPSSPMGEYSETWSSQGLKNLWGTVPEVIEMQSEGVAAGWICTMGTNACPRKNIANDYRSVLSSLQRLSLANHCRRASKGMGCPI